MCRKLIPNDAKACQYCQHKLLISEIDTFESRIWPRRLKIALLLGLGFWMVSYCRNLPPATPEETQAGLNAILGDSAPNVIPVEVKIDQPYFKTTTKMMCKQNYPDDFAMRAACTRNAKDGFRDFSQMWFKFENRADVRAALSTCFERYTKGDVTDFSMAGACSRNQQDGIEQTEN